MKTDTNDYVSYRNLVARTNGTGTVTRFTSAQLDRATQSSETEAETVKAIRDALHAYGYETCVVSQRGGRGSGTTTGFPDLAVRRHTWPQGVALLCEVKKPSGGRLSAEQADLHARGWSQVVRSADEALAAARGFGDWMEAGR